MYVGQQFDELINQGQRECIVIAVDGTRFLYEYVMPNNTSAIRNEQQRPISYLALSTFWLRLIEDQYGIDNLVATPQGFNYCGCGGTCRFPQYHRRPGFMRQEMKDRLAAGTEKALNRLNKAG